MKTGKRIGSLLLALMLLLALAACGAAPEAAWTPEKLAAGEITEQSAADLLAYLTSPVLQGRAVGSDGNVQAAKDIAALFAALGYEPLKPEEREAAAALQVSCRNRLRAIGNVDLP